MPEFAALVEKQAPVVVNISATRQTKVPKAPFLRSERDDGIPGWLQRMLPAPPDMLDEEEDDRATGSGFVIGVEGYILTNAHVVEGASEILVRFNDRREYPGRLVGADRRTDVALLKVDARNLRQARLGDPARLRVGDWVLAIGSPFGFESSVTAGIVSAKGRSLPDESLVPFIQTDVAINPGNSGGPLFNLSGEVIGINSQIYSRTGGFMGLSFAIPIDVAMDVQAQLRQNGRVRRGRIGVLVQEVTRDMADSFGLAQPIGALVSQIDAGGPAAAAGIKSGDIIVRFDGKEVKSSSDLPRIVGGVRPGMQTVVQYWRAARLQTAQLAVAEFAEESSLVPVRQTEPSLRGANALGLIVQDLSRDERHTTSGVAIREVLGAAGRAELRQGDVVVALVLHGAPSDIRSATHFNRMVNDLPRGSAVTLLVRRGDAQSFVAMKVPGK
ncbi:Do family serine endopeptidase [Uliginosibacterium sp. 31-16]|uniref:Do family serine endopeptidase n=1 Tax=Uliginosibacterium sp. 31-16 TaxID=3068315 RepID=UPI00273DDDDC|nr:Do family serine endopeptidase [Uliginosibacterium sp. 31-16]MDP5240855.1 Do family serine endopeptidase [Uliginosibacterium sp. 31-16]